MDLVLPKFSAGNLVQHIFIYTFSTTHYSSILAKSFSTLSSNTFSDVRMKYTSMMFLLHLCGTSPHDSEVLVPFLLSLPLMNFFLLKKLFLNSWPKIHLFVKKFRQVSSIILGDVLQSK